MAIRYVPAVPGPDSASSNVKEHVKRAQNRLEEVRRDLKRAAQDEARDAKSERARARS